MQIVQQIMDNFVLNVMPKTVQLVLMEKFSKSKITSVVIHQHKIIWDVFNMKAYALLHALNVK